MPTTSLPQRQKVEHKPHSASAIFRATYLVTVVLCTAYMVYMILST